MHRYLIGLFALTVGCSSSNSGAGGSPGTSANVSGSSSGTACVYRERLATDCGDGGVATSWTAYCDDMSCADVSWDPGPWTSGSCSGEKQFSAKVGFAGTCAQWKAAGSVSGCGNFSAYQGTSTQCQDCLAQSCCAETLECNTGSACDALAVCLGRCANDPSCGGDGGVCACETACENAHSAGVSAANTWVTCLDNFCGSECN